MSLPTYEEYRDSGVPWLGAVPLHWAVQRFKWLIERNDGGVWGDDPDGVDDTVVLRSTEQSVDGRWRIDEPAKRKLTEKDRLSALLEVGDLLLTKSSGSALHIGKTTLVDELVASIGACYSNFTQRLRVVDDFCPRLAWYILNNSLARVQLDLLSNSTTGLANLNGTIIGELLLALPPQKEQSAIADFLDRETAKIDTLIAEQEKLIALLAEKRQATISHVVTRGLNPDVPMKDSGVAWLGEVPVHWKLARLGRYATVENGTTPSRAVMEYWEDGNIPWLASGEVNQRQISEASEFITAVALESTSLRLLPVGTVVVGMIGQGKTRGMSAILRISATINQNLAAICPGPHIKSGYVLYVFHAMYEWLREAGRGGNQAAMNCEMLSALQIPIPALAEQEAIVSFIESKLSKLEALSAQAEGVISLLKERRSALISAAVTGQIDVRGLVASTAAI